MDVFEQRYQDWKDGNLQLYNDKSLGTTDDGKQPALDEQMSDPVDVESPSSNISSPFGSPMKPSNHTSISRRRMGAMASPKKSSSKRPLSQPSLHITNLETEDVDIESDFQCPEIESEDSFDMKDPEPQQQNSEFQRITRSHSPLNEKKVESSANTEHEPALKKQRLGPKVVSKVEKAMLVAVLEKYEGAMPDMQCRIKLAEQLHWSTGGIYNWFNRRVAKGKKAKTLPTASTLPDNTKPKIFDNTPTLMSKTLPTPTPIKPLGAQPAPLLESSPQKLITGSPQATSTPWFLQDSYRHKVAPLPTPSPSLLYPLQSSLASFLSSLSSISPGKQMFSTQQAPSPSLSTPSERQLAP
jgi:hypothetical protein